MCKWISAGIKEARYSSESVLPSFLFFLIYSWKTKTKTNFLPFLQNYCISNMVTQGNTYQCLTESVEMERRYLCILQNNAKLITDLWIWTEWYRCRHRQCICGGFKAGSAQAVTTALFQNPVLKVNTRQLPSSCYRVCKFILYQIQQNPISFWQHTMHLAFSLCLNFVCCRDSVFLLWNV